MNTPQPYQYESLSNIVEVQKRLIEEQAQLIKQQADIINLYRYPTYVYPYTTVPLEMKVEGVKIERL
jgi:hypothetical protein